MRRQMKSHSLYKSLHYLNGHMVYMQLKLSVVIRYFVVLS